MNKYTLLTATAILSMGTMVANADPGDLEPGGLPEVGSTQISNLNTKIHARAILTTALSVTETSTLDFGTIINPQNNGVVVVTKTGTLGSETDSQVITSSQTTGWGIRAGAITVSGGYINSYLPDQNQDTPQSFDYTYGITFPEEIVLKDRKTGNITCGKVTNFSTDGYSGSTGDGDDPTISYGGKLTLDSAIKNNLGANTTMECEGEGTATLIYTVNMGAYQFQQP